MIEEGVARAMKRRKEEEKGGGGGEEWREWEKEEEEDDDEEKIKGRKDSQQELRGALEGPRGKLTAESSFTQSEVVRGGRLGH